MKQIIILIFILSTFVDAKKLTLTKKDVNMINSSKDKSFIINRFKQYKNMINDAKNLSIEKKLTRVNNFFNRIFPIDDNTKYSADDYWATRKEFIIAGYGDCEDYTISKYFTLLELGVKKEKLYFAVVQVIGKTTYHMNLLYFETPTSIPLVLDNLNFKIKPLNKRDELEPKFAFNEFDSYLLKKNGLDKKIKVDWGEVDKWELLLQRIYDKNE